ncbi:hypothetical protein GGF37_003735 [Kickxella alabastrina]|nr:hypothetical protein GGF37_003735 [Kickxella alabastrina]
MVEADDNIFGRRMQCFLATMAIPTANQSSRNKHCTRLVRDVWRGPESQLVNSMDFGILYRDSNRTNSLNTHIARPCLHRQYVTGLTSLPVTKVNSIQELIVVVKDAMKAYSEFNNIIDIVHRNLTPDAICFRCLEGGRVKGMLADFAQSYNSKLCAVDKEKNIGIPVPFISVSMIERNLNPITKTEAKKSTVELVQEAGRKFWVVSSSQ